MSKNKTAPKCTVDDRAQGRAAGLRASNFNHLYAAKRDAAPIVALIKRGDLRHYRYLARQGTEDAVRGALLIAAADLEECLEAIEAMETGELGDRVYFPGAG